MPAVEVKICGLTRAADVDAAIAAGADYCGFVHHPGSRRHLAARPLARLARRARERGVRTVLVVVDPTPDALASLVEETGADIVQLHGQESPASIAVWRSALPATRFWKGIAVGGHRDVAALAGWSALVDALVLDAPAPPGAAHGGGSATVFDWSLLAGRAVPRPFLLAGGLETGNVVRAVATIRPDGVDVSSGVETSPGIKDPDRIAAFMGAAHGAAGQQGGEE